MHSNSSSEQWVLSPWVGFFTLVLGAWAVLFAMTAGLAEHSGAAALGPGMGWSGSLLATLSEQTGAGELHLHSTHDSFRLLVAMWCLMSVAMMAPTAVPMLQAYHHMVQGNPDRIPQSGFWGLLGGYLAVWFLFSLAMAIAQRELGAVGLLTDLGVSATAWFSAALLGLAAAYQFSSLKQACLSRCRSPMAFFLSRWREGIAGALSMGLYLGVICVGCCWALMALAFVGGTMNLAWMGAAMVLMIVEKLSIGRWLTVPLGFALGVAATAVATKALFVN